MTSNKIIRNLIVLLTIITMLLIVPASFALENNTGDLNPDISASEMDGGILTDDGKYDTVYVDASNGNDGGSGTSESPLKTISEGLNHVNDGGTIYLNGTFSGDGNANLTFDAKPNSVTFIGNERTVIDGMYSNTFVTASKGEYTFEGISFVNHYKSGDEINGGAISNLNAKMTFKNCLFENNTVYGINKGHGGAIDSTGTVNIIDCTFKNNVANVSNSSGHRKNSADGGALSNLGTLNVYNSTFIENKALRNGGAIRTQDHSTTFIDGCTFTGNVAAYHLSGGSYGGAIYTWDCGLELYNSTFTNNWVYDASGYGAHGGALSLNRGTGKIFIYSCAFINNTADGVSTVDGQSIYFESIEAVVNYCAIDTSIYSISQSTDLNYNWWAVNDTNINALIENLPSSAAVKTFAELKITSDSEGLEVGKETDIYINLYWNGTTNQNKMNLIPLRTVKLDCTGGTLADDCGELDYGFFTTGLTPTGGDILLKVTLGNVTYESDLSETSDSNIKIRCDDAIEGKSAVVKIESDNESDYCILEINDNSYFAKLNKGKGTAVISGLTSGKYVGSVKFYNKQSELINESTVRITVKPKLDAQMNATFKQVIGTGEALNIHVELAKNASGNVETYIDGAKADSTKIQNGIAAIDLGKIAEGLHSIEIRYCGDDMYREQSSVAAMLVGDSKKDTHIEVEKSFAIVASDIAAGETGGYVYATLKDSQGNALANKPVQFAVNGEIYSRTTDDNGVAGLQINIASANTYTCVISFNGDEGYNAAQVAITTLKVTKKSTSIKVTAKAFKSKAKTKTLKVTLKTSKNKNDGKTYLSKGKKLTLTINKKTHSAKTNKNGVAKFNIKLTKRGKFSAVVKFKGDDTYKASSKKVKITIK